MNNEDKLKLAKLKKEELQVNLDIKNLLIAVNSKLQIVVDEIHSERRTLERRAISVRGIPETNKRLHNIEETLKLLLDKDN